MLRLLVLISTFLFSACSAPKDVRETRFIMGTLVEFTVDVSDSEHAEAAIAAAANEMQRIENAFTIYGEHDNAVKVFNRSQPGTPVALPAEVAALLKEALQIKQQSGGAFDPALGKLNLLWGFSGSELPSSPPSAGSIAAAIPPSHCIGQQGDKWVRLDERCLLDFGAIAKGYAIDLGITVLKEHGINNAIINAGGDIRLIGRHGDRAWRIGIRHPRIKGEVIETLELEGDVAVVTSGDYERFFIHEGTRFHHIINPETGYPATGAQSATVIAPSATLADGWSTALFIQGEEGLSLQHQLKQPALVIDSKGKVLGSLKGVDIKCVNAK